MLCSFRLALEGKVSKDILKLSRLEFLEQVSEKNFVLSNVEDISGLLNPGGIALYLF